MYACQLHHETSCNRLACMEGGRGGREHLGSRMSCQARIDLSVNSRATFAVFSHLRKHYICQPVMAYLYANYVRYECSMQIQEGKSAPGSTHALSSMRDTSSARSVHLQIDQQQTVQKLCSNGAQSRTFWFERQTCMRKSK